MAESKKPKATAKTTSAKTTSAKTTSAKTAPAKASTAKASPPAAARVRLQVGEPAPSFSATITDGSTIHSKDLLGKPVVVYFYPRDDTPRTTAPAFRRSAWASRNPQASLVHPGVSSRG